MRLSAKWGKVPKLRFTRSTVGASRSLQPRSALRVQASLLRQRMPIPASNSARQSSIHGGYGFCKEYPVERYYRDAKAFTIIGGTNQIQRKIIADEVKKTYAL